MRLITTKLPTHGSGPYYDVALQWTPNKVVRVSVGGYGWHKPPLTPNFLRYPGIAYIGIGPVSFSVRWR